MWDSTLQKCVINPNYVGKCFRNEKWNRKSRSCICRRNYFLNPKNKRCTLIDCKTTQKWSKKWLRCRPIICPRFMKWNNNLGSCKCIEGKFYSRKQQRCIPIFCPPGQKFNFKLEKCMNKRYCKSYQKLVGKKCICPKKCGLGRKHNYHCRCAIRTPNCPKRRKCRPMWYKWNGAEGKCRCEKIKTWFNKRLLRP